MKQRTWLQVTAGDEQLWQKGTKSGAVYIILDMGNQTLSEAEEFFRGRLPAKPFNVAQIYLQLDYAILSETRALLDAALTAGISGIVLRSPENGSNVQELDVMLSVQEAIAGRNVGETRIVAMVGDSPAGILNATTFPGCSERLIAIGWDLVRFSRLTGAALSSDIVLTAQTTTILTAFTCQVGAIDTQDHEQDMEIFRSKCETAKAEGFTSKIAVSAPQLQLINAVFSDKV